MKFSHRLQYLFMVLFYAWLRLLPRTWAGMFGAILGQTAYFIGIRRKVVDKNLQTAFPHLPLKARNTVSARVFRHFGRVAAAFARLPKLKAQAHHRWIFIEGLEVFEEVLKQGKGGIVVSGHLGNWELMGGICALLGYPVSFVVTTQRNKLVEKMIDDYRRNLGIEIIKRKEATRGVLTALKKNRLVAILIDQDAHEDGAFVPFFGRLSSTPRGPAVFHLKTGAPMIFAESVLLPGEKYKIKLSLLETGDCGNADEITALATAKLEAAVRRTPEQWFWMHKRWKTSPIES